MISSNKITTSAVSQLKITYQTVIKYHLWVITTNVCLISVPLSQNPRYIQNKHAFLNRYIHQQTFRLFAINQSMDSLHIFNLSLDSQHNCARFVTFAPLFQILTNTKKAKYPEIKRRLWVVAQSQKQVLHSTVHMVCVIFWTFQYYQTLWVCFEWSQYRRHNIVISIKSQINVLTSDCRDTIFMKCYWN